MAEIQDKIGCCGISELDGIESQTPLESLRDAVNGLSQGGDEVSAAFVFFSTVEGNNGVRLATLIRNKKLGTVTKIPPNRNPNTDNRLSMWVWGVSEQATLAYWKKFGDYKDNEWDA